MRFEPMILAMSVASVALAATPALAAMDASDAVGVCSRISKKDARLECYDQVARDTASGTIQPRAQGAPVAAAAAASGAVAASQSWSAPAAPQSWSAPPPPGAAPQSQQAQTDGFGAQQVRRSKDEQGPSSIKAEVAASADNGLGQWKVTLADGAIWQMTERVALFRPPAPHEAVTIRQGSMGGFLMEVGKQQSVRVMRVR